MIFHISPTRFSHETRSRVLCWLGHVVFRLRGYRRIATGVNINYPIVWTYEKRGRG